MTASTPNVGVDLTGHPEVADTFTYECLWGCTIHVERSVEQPHRCRARQVVLDYLVTGPPSVTWERTATDIVKALEPLVREQLAKACDPDQLGEVPDGS